MNGFFDNLAYWHWWVFAVVLIIFELLTPGAFFLWLSVAASIVGLILLIIPDIGWELQLILFSLISVLAIAIANIWFKRNPIKSSKPSLNQREDDLIGKVFEVEQAIINGSGRVKVGESTWKANGPNSKRGTLVRVIRVDGAELFVEPVQ